MSLKSIPQAKKEFEIASHESSSIGQFSWSTVISCCYVTSYDWFKASYRVLTVGLRGKAIQTKEYKPLAPRNAIHFQIAGLLTFVFIWTCSIAPFYLPIRATIQEMMFVLCTILQ